MWEDREELDKVFPKIDLARKLIVERGVVNMNPNPPPQDVSPTIAGESFATTEEIPTRLNRRECWPKGEMQQESPILGEGLLY